MRNLNMFLVMVALVLLGMSCSKEAVENEQQPGENKALSVQVEVEDFPAETKAGIKNAFAEGDQVGLFITAGSAGSPYGGDPSNFNNPLSYTSGSWSLGRPVYLSVDNALIYGYYPYDSSVPDITAIPVTAVNQVNYLYGTHATSTPVNSRNPEVSLKMHHALSCVKFMMKKEDYPGTGKVTRVEISNKAGKSFFYSQGHMNATTGVITPDKENVSSVYLENTSTGLIPSLKETFPTEGINLLVLPVIEATGAQGDIVISITVDGTTYKWTQLPSATTWQAATTNVYQVTLKGSALEIGGDGGGTSIEIEPWSSENKGDISII